jgi:6-phosphogluconolactonase (cycloisomerase 2 family)
MKKALAVAVPVSIVLFSFLAMTGCGSKGNLVTGPTPTPTPGPGHSFVYTANTGGNTISAFSNDSNGSLTQITGSPLNFPGNPIGIAATPNGKFLYVSSFQNASVTGFSINATSGALTALSCAAGVTGTQPLNIAITPAGTFLYTSDQQPGGVSGFSIDANTGCLTGLGSVASDAIARGLTVDRSGKFLYVVTGGGGIDAFSIAVNGSLTRLATSGFDSGTTTMTSVQASPTADILLATDAGNANALRSLTIAGVTGALTPVSTLSQGSGPSAIAFPPTGAFAYVANTTSNTISINTVAAGGALTAGQPANDATGPVALAIDTTGQFLYVANNGSSNVTAFKIAANGTLSPVGTFATGSGPNSIAVVSHP